MNQLWIDFALITGLVCLNGLLAGSEMALVSLREGQRRRLGSKDRRGRRLLELTGNPNEYLGAIQLGITLAGFLASATAAVSLSEPIADAVPFDRGATAIGVGVVSVGVAALNLVFGELVPKRLGMQRAEAWSLTAARPVSILISVTRPLVVAVGFVTDRAVRLLGGDPRISREEFTQEEIVALVSAQPTLHPSQRQIIAGAVEIGHRLVRDVVVPRRQVLTVDASAPALEAARLLQASGHSRGPVVVQGLDDCVGQVHVRDLVGATGNVGRYAAPVLALPDSLTVLAALHQLREDRSQLALVVNEHGGAEGIVTAADLVDEVVGDVFSLGGAHEPTSRPGGGVVVAGSYPIHEMANLQVALPDGPYSTVAGLILHRLGAIPTVGERVMVGSWTLDVLGVADRAVTSVLIAPVDAAAQEPDGSEHERGLNL